MLLTTHRPEVALFALGRPASAGLFTLAEEGNVAPLRATLQSSASVTATEAGNALLEPGQSVTFRIQGNLRVGRRPLPDPSPMPTEILGAW